MMIRWVGRWTLLMLAGGAPLLAQEPASKEPPAPPPASPYDALELAFNEAQQKFWESFKENTEPDWSKNPAKEFMPKFRKLAEDNAGKPEALKALVWILTNARMLEMGQPAEGEAVAAVPAATTEAGKSDAGDAKPDKGDAKPEKSDAKPEKSESKPEKEEAKPAKEWVPATPLIVKVSAADEVKNWALERIKRDHLADAAIKDLMPNLRYLAYDMGSKPVMELSEAILAKNKDRDVQAHATFNMAWAMYNPFVDVMQTDEKAREANKTRAVELFRKVVKDFADTDAAKEAAPFIFEIEHLQVGMKAPDIAGKDIDEKDIKLSGFAGKVVVLDFWGFW
ncbi:MAG: hypothetical protein IT449_04130 [Phycisphaerales bacterium]|nr:hypothetical protein [Phycisphaerales bacterium]